VHKFVCIRIKLDIFGAIFRRAVRKSIVIIIYMGFFTTLVWSDIFFHDLMDFTDVVKFSERVVYKYYKSVHLTGD
jgi:hypothetical protein